MDPIGTVRREDHEEGGYSIWQRQHPGYPDIELPDTEWTCVWSTATGNIGIRHADDITTCSEVVGQTPGTPAETGSDVEIDDKVLVWAHTPAPAPGRIVEIYGSEGGRTRTFSIELTDSVTGELGVYKGFKRPYFDLVQED